MQSLMYLIKQHSLIRVLSLIVASALLLCTLHSGSESVRSIPEEQAQEVFLTTSSGSFSEVNYEEQLGRTFLKAATVRSNTSVRLSTIRSAVLLSLLAVILFLLTLCGLSGFVYFRTVIPGNLIIIRYIHDLDGLKD